MARQLPSIQIPPSGVAPLLFLLAVRAILYVRDQIREWTNPV